MNEIKKVKVKRTPETVKLGDDYYYHKNQLLGSGNYANVYKGVKKDTQQYVAIKVLSKERIQNSNIQGALFLKELYIMKNISHPNIVDFYEVVQDRKHYYLIMEFLSGQELTDSLMEKQYFSEAQTRQIFILVLDAVRYLHKKGIVHRDLKPQNILYTTNLANNRTLKIIDFGVSSSFGNRIFLSTRIGTPLYMAPEILKGQKYQEGVDVWSMGIILYLLLCGYPPIISQIQKQIIQELEKFEVSFKQEGWLVISKQVKDLIRRMLQKQPKQRITIEQIYKHPWMQKQIQKQEQPQKKKLSNNIKRFKNLTKLLKDTKNKKIKQQKKIEQKQEKKQESNEENQERISMKKREEEQKYEHD